MSQKLSEGANLRTEIRNLRREGEPDRALEKLQKGKSSAKIRGLRFERASLLHTLSRNEEALKELNRIPEHKVKPRVRLLRARVLIALNRLDEAAELLRSSEMGNAKQAPVLKLLARGYLDAGLFQSAALAARDARKQAKDGAIATRCELSAQLLSGEITHLAEALETHGTLASGALVSAVKFALIQLARDNDEIDHTAVLDQLVASMLQSLCLVTDPEAISSIRLMLRGLIDDETDKKLWDRRGELVRELPISSYKNLEPPEKTLKKARSNRLERVAEWLGVDAAETSEWCSAAERGIQFQRRLNLVALHSDSVLEEMKADLEPMDWSEVQACHEQDQPVLLVTLHCGFIPAMQIQLNRLNLGVKAIAGNWWTRWSDEFAPLYLDLPGKSQFETQAGKYSGHSLSRSMLQHLNSNGIAIVMADGGTNAGVRDLEEQGLRAELPAPLWTVARRTGAAIFYMECVWRDGALTSRLVRWNVPEDDASDQAANVWYNLLLDAYRSACLADPRNVVPTKWLMDLEPG